MSDYLSEELVAEILKRVPVKSLLKFTSVCKLWYSLITNPNFISFHLAHTTQANETYLLVKKNISYGRKPQFVLHRDNDSFSEYQKLDLSSFFAKENLDNGIKIAGSCNGLVCLFDKINNRLILWNPAIGELITTSLNVRNKRMCVVVGFGFDRKNNDYKVVTIVYDDYSKIYSKFYLLGEIIQPSIELFELGSNVWRTITFKSLNYLVVGCSCAYLNGITHWFAQLYNGIAIKTMITSFDLSSEAFEDIMLPNALAKLTNHLSLSLTVYRQSLAVICYETLDMVNCNYLKCSIWVMKEYGALESWTKLFTIDLENRGGFKLVLGFQGNGGILIDKSDADVASYDPQTQRMTQLVDSDGGCYSVAQC
ncbi:putative F-box protein At3g17490 [Mercurialis annua]|uniref:putative F-box protein At3g17490 n=1 Tax=Mercurialis annua TaxID=3986 RepID=UPI00215E201C|nr:putative F-box protein At3g17490 [Mercurialis annua]